MKEELVELNGETMESLRTMLNDDEVFQKLRIIAEREDRACWIAWYNLELIEVIRQASAWQSGAEVPPPERMVSALLRPGDGTDGGFAHRRRSFVRAATSRGFLNTGNFYRMKATDYQVLDDLGRLMDADLVEEMRRRMDAFYEYLERAQEKHYSDEQMRDALSTKVDGMCELLQRMYEACRTAERVRMGEAMMTPGEQMVSQQVEAVSCDVRTLLRREKRPPASSRVQRWVVEQWLYYNRHPEALIGEQARKRVYVRDVWATVERVARESYGIADLKEFRRILRTAQKSEGRRR